MNPYDAKHHRPHAYVAPFIVELAIHHSDPKNHIILGGWNVTSMIAKRYSPSNTISHAFVLFCFLISWFPSIHLYKYFFLCSFLSQGTKPIFSETSLHLLVYWMNLFYLWRWYVNGHHDEINLLLLLLFLKWISAVNGLHNFIFEVVC